MDPPNKQPNGHADSGRGISFDDFVISVAMDIFAEALGKRVAQVLIHNFHSREPSLLQGESGTDKLATFQKVLAESFGEFHINIMQIVTEEVCTLMGISSAAAGARTGLLEEAKVAYATRGVSSAGTA